jgi:hypothetical protein
MNNRRQQAMSNRKPQAPGRAKAVNHHKRPKTESQ